MDPTTGTIDMDLIQTGISAGARTARAQLTQELRTLIQSERLPPPPNALLPLRCVTVLKLGSRFLRQKVAMILFLALAVWRTSGCHGVLATAGVATALVGHSSSEDAASRTSRAWRLPWKLVKSLVSWWRHGMMC
jgi:hypothetical protein